MCLLCPSNYPNADGMLVDWRCHDRLRDQLDPDHHGNLEHADPASIPVLHALLTPHKDSAGDDSSRRAPGFASTVIINTHSVSMLDHRSKANGQPWTDRAGRWHWETDTPPLSTAAVLAGWARIVIDDRPLSGLPGLWTVPTLARLLHTHLDWCCAQPWIPDMADELRTLHSQLRSATRAATGEYRPRPVGACHAPAPEDAARECGGPLWSPRVGSVISCGWCGARYEAWQWLDLADQLADTAEVAS